ncbi:DUF3833 family protein [Sulfitobacter aestuarii]|uniref:DUF3833 family protein n=1 Tax=Sulfitobacter aestuarii TaxID=2161676 RepID=A0ABW5U1P7_9RHOB
MEPLLFFATGLVLASGVIWLRCRYGSFSGQRPSDYAEGFDELDIRRTLDGKMICEGVIFGPFGRMTSSFTADFDMRWQGRRGVLREDFLYDDRSRQNREWAIELGDSGHFTATAPDVLGKARGEQCGPALRLCYAIRLPPEQGGHVLHTVDWLYLTPAGTLVNRSQFRKYGIKVAELVATIRPKDDI